MNVNWKPRGASEQIGYCIFIEKTGPVLLPHTFTYRKPKVISLHWPTHGNWHNYHLFHLKFATNWKRIFISHSVLLCIIHYIVLTNLQIEDKLWQYWTMRFHTWALHMESSKNLLLSWFGIFQTSILSYIIYMFRACIGKYWLVLSFISKYTTKNTNYWYG